MSPSKQKTVESLQLNKPAGKLPGPMDAVIFRGSGTNLHDGSKRFRSMVDSHIFDFTAAKSNPEKKGIVMECIQKHKAMGGRFVGYYNGAYYHATEKKAYNKVIQRLRDQKLRALREFDQIQILEEDFDDLFPSMTISSASKA